MPLSRLSGIRPLAGAAQSSGPATLRRVAPRTPVEWPRAPRSSGPATPVEWPRHPRSSGPATPGRVAPRPVTRLLVSLTLEGSGGEQGQRVGERGPADRGPVARPTGLWKTSGARVRSCLRL